MASFVYNAFKEQLVDGTYDWDAGQTYRVALVNVALTAATETDVATVLGSGSKEYGSARVDLASLTVSSGSTVGMDAADTVFTSLAADGSEQVVALLVYVNVAGGDANSKPVATFLLATPFYGNGATVTFTWHASGLITLT
jgi:hypothetical protein